MNILKPLLISGGVLLASIALFVLPAQEAQAAPTPHIASISVQQTVKTATACGLAACTVDSIIYSESNWESSYDDSATGKPNPGYAPSNNVFTYTGCSTWLPQGGGQSTGSYPAENSGSHNCFFADGGASGGGSGSVNFACPPHPDRASNGRINVYYRDPDTGERVFKYMFCAYVTDEFAPIERNLGSGKIYTGGQGDFFNTGAGTTQAGTYGNTGSKVSTSGYIDRGVDLSNPEAYAGSWLPAFTAATGVNANGTPRYGFHRLQWTLDYRNCTKWAYPSWLGVPVRYDCAAGGQDQVASPYTYGCNSNPALQQGINAGAKFKASECETSWACVIDGNTRIGGIPDVLDLLRNGEPNKVTYPTVGVSGGSIQNARSWKVKNELNAGSTPTQDFVKNSWSWSKWETYKQDANTVSFNWASDTASQPWSFSSRFSYVAEYNVPTQDSVVGATTYEWVTDSTECPQTIQSAKAVVVRSTGG
jgi:hypothetical protein